MRLSFMQAMHMQRLKNGGWWSLLLFFVFFTGLACGRHSFLCMHEAARNNLCQSVWATCLEQGANVRAVLGGVLFMLALALCGGTAAGVVLIPGVLFVWGVAFFITVSAQMFSISLHAGYVFAFALAFLVVSAALLIVAGICFEGARYNFSRRSRALHVRFFILRARLPLFLPWAAVYVVFYYLQFSARALFRA